MNPIRLKQVLAFSGLESCIYQLLLFGHQCALYRFIGAVLYGEIGTLFSLVYLVTNHINLGLDASLAPCVAKTSHLTKGDARHILLHSNFNVMLAAIGALVALFFVTPEHYGSLFICSLLVIAESIKKSCKTLLGLLLLQRVTTLVEAIGLSIYIASVWSALMLGYAASLSTIILPLLIASTISITFYLYYLVAWYKTLPSYAQSVNDTRLGMLRVKNYLYQLSHSWYSSNALIPIMALTLPMEAIGILKMLAMGAYSINSIIHHIFGVGSSVIFAHIKKDHTKNKYKTFSKLYTALLGSIALLLAGLSLHYFWSEISLSDGYLYTAYLFLILISIEHAGITHEYFYIVEEKTNFLIGANATLTGALIATYYYHSSIPNHLILLLLCLRMLYLVGLYCYGRYYWNLTNIASCRTRQA